MFPLRETRKIPLHIGRSEMLPRQAEIFAKFCSEVFACTWMMSSIDISFLSVQELLYRSEFRRSLNTLQNMSISKTTAFRSPSRERLKREEDLLKHWFHFKCIKEILCYVLLYLWKIIFQRNICISAFGLEISIRKGKETQH